MSVFRLTVVMTHPVQYFSPWFRFIAETVPELALTVLYGSEPLPEQQGAGFGASFAWDTSLRDGYRNEVLEPADRDHDFRTGRFWGMDVPAIGDALVSTKPDAVLVNGWHSMMQIRAIRACRRHRIPLLYRGDTHLAGRNGQLRHAPWRLRTRWLLNRFDRYLSVGVRARGYLESFGIPDENVFDSPHAVDNEFFAQGARPFQSAEKRAETRREWDLSPDGFVVLFVGKLETVKRPSDLVRAIRLVGKDAVLLVIGTGPLEDECRKRAAELDAPVRFHGFVNQSALGRAYALADCLALPSVSESWGLVVNEAMATGLPCVVSDGVGCAPDLVSPGETGEVFPVGDVRALGAALERLRLETRSGQSRAEACRRQVSRYSFEKAANGLLAACRSAAT